MKSVLVLAILEMSSLASLIDKEAGGCFLNDVLLGLGLSRMLSELLLSQD